MKKIIWGLFGLLLLLATGAEAQVGPQGVRQSGAVVANHCVKWVANNVIADAGANCNSTASDITVGSTTVTGGSTGRILYDNAGVLGEMTTSGSGTVVALATGATLTTPVINSAAHVGGTWVADAAWTLPAVTLGGAVTATGQTITNGTFASPTLTTPSLGVASATSINFGGGACSTYTPPTAFTPGLQFGGAAVGMTGTFTGRYSQVCGVLTYIVNIALSAKGSSTGTALITGLPVACATVPAQYSFVWTFIDLNVAGGYYQLSGNTNAGNTTIALFQGGDNVDVSALTNANFADNSLFRATGTCFAS